MRNTGPGARIAHAVSWLKANYAQPLRVPTLASKLAMSTSSLREHFRTATGMTPPQYQKALRLGEARRLMIVDLLDVTTAAHTVGCTSPSQFSRDYRRACGESPLRDAHRLRTPTSLRTLHSGARMGVASVVSAGQAAVVESGGRSSPQPDQVPTPVTSRSMRSSETTSRSMVVR